MANKKAKESTKSEEKIVKAVKLIAATQKEVDRKLSELASYCKDKTCRVK